MQNQRQAQRQHRRPSVSGQGAGNEENVTSLENKKPGVSWTDGSVKAIQKAVPSSAAASEAGQRSTGSGSGRPRGSSTAKASLSSVSSSASSSSMSSRVSATSLATSTATPASKRWTLNEFEVGRSLGKGKFGQVYLARTKKEKKIVALKVLFKDELERSELNNQLKREIEIHHRLKHKNVVRLFSYFHDADRVYLVLEYCPGGELFTELKNSPSGRFSEERASNVIRQLVSALERCHLLGVVHRDIKPENILVCRDGSIKLADFGWASATVDAKTNMRMTLCGTQDYLAPELLDGDGYGDTIDIWCTGILMFEMLVGTAPFVPENPHESDVLASKKCDFQIPAFISREAKDLLKLVLVKDPAMRLSPIGNILLHKWITKHAPKEETGAIIMKSETDKKKAATGRSLK